MFNIGFIATHFVHSSYATAPLEKQIRGLQTKESIKIDLVAIEWRIACKSYDAEELGVGGGILPHTLNSAAGRNYIKLYHLMQCHKSTSAQWEMHMECHFNILQLTP